MPERSVEIRLEVVNGAQAREQILRLGDGEAALNKVGQGAKQASAGLDQVGISAERAARQASSRMVNLSAQIQDVVVSLQGGQDPLRVFIQQGSQIASTWGVVGGQIGIAVAVIGTLVSVLYNLASAGEESTEAADLLKAATADLNNILEASTEDIIENAKAIDKLTEAQKELARQQGVRDIAANTAVLDQQSQVIRNLAESLSEEAKERAHILELRQMEMQFGSTPVSPAAAEEAERARNAINALTKELDTVIGLRTPEEFKNVAISLGALTEAFQFTNPEIFELGKQLQEAALTGEKAGEVIKTLSGNLQLLAGDTSALDDATWLKQFEENAKSAMRGADQAIAAAERAAAQRVETVAGLGLESEQMQRLAEAQAKSAEEGRRVEIAIMAQNAVRKLGAEATQRQKEEVYAETVAIELSKDAVKESTQARSDAAAAGKKAASEARQAAEEQERAAEKRRETISDLQFEVDQLELVADAEIKGAEAGREAEIAMIAETAARKLGTDASEAQRQTIIDETIARERLTDEIKASQEARDDEARAVKEAQDTIDRARKQASDKATREQERMAEEQAKAFARPFERAADSIQDTFTDTFEEIYSGGVTSFGDLADAIKQIMIRMAAEMTTLAIFRPGAFMGGAGAAGQPGAAPGTAGGASVASSLGFMGGGVNTFGSRLGLAGPVIGANGQPLMLPSGQPLMKTGPFGSTAGLSTLLGAGMMGAAGGTVIGGFFGGQGATGGALGGGGGAALGALLGSAFPGVGTVAGGVAGGLLGSLGGGFLGSLFGSGGDRDTGPLRFGTGTGGTGDIFRGVFGNLRIGGEDAFAKPLADMVNQFDSGVAQFLTTRQKDRVEQALSGLDEFSGRFPEDDPSEGFAQILRTRATSILSALGLDPNKIIGGFTSTEDITARTQQALQTQAQIQDLTAKSGDQLSKQLADINEQFAELTDTAREYGISTQGLAKAQREARQEVIAQARGELTQGLLGLGSPFEALADPLRAFKTQIGFGQQSPAEQFKTLQADFNRLAKEARGGSLSAIGQLQGAGQALLSAAGTYGASPEIARVSTQISSVLDSVLGNLERAQDRASAGLEGAIARASRAQIDTMHELVAEQRKAVSELRSLNRALNKLPRAA